MKKNSYVNAMVLGLLTISIMTACNKDNEDIVSNPEPDAGESQYVIPAAVGDASYLITAESLDEGEVTVAGNGTEVLNASYWVYKDHDYVFALVYNKGGAGTGASYYLNVNGKPVEKYAYTYNRITTYGTWGDNVITASTGDASAADENGYYPQVLLFNYLNAKDGSHEIGRAHV